MRIGFLSLPNHMDQAGVFAYKASIPLHEVRATSGLNQGTTYQF